MLCRIRSALTGSRLVSLPFADHCDLLIKDSEQPEFCNWLIAACDCEHLKYVEIRPRSPLQARGMEPSASYSFHELDLSPGLGDLFSRLHKNSIQRRIQRAEREGFTYEVGCSGSLLKAFYRLLAITRRRHRLLPQPRAWFENLLLCMRDAVEIRLASKDSVPMAAILTLRHKSTVIYKYGCSDHRFHSLGVMPFLFWRLIEESKQQGLSTLDFGRSDVEQASLRTFKDKFGTVASTLTYYRYPRMLDRGAGWLRKAAGAVFAVLPEPAQATAGKFIYRHVG